MPSEKVSTFKTPYSPNDRLLSSPLGRVGSPMRRGDLLPFAVAFLKHPEMKEEPKFVNSLIGIAREVLSTKEAIEMNGNWLEDKALFLKTKKYIDERVEKSRKEFMLTDFDVSDNRNIVDLLLHNSELNLDVNDVAFLIITNHPIFEEGRWKEIDKRDLLDATLTQDTLGWRSEAEFRKTVTTYYSYEPNLCNIDDINKRIKQNEKFQQKLRRREQ